MPDAKTILGHIHADTVARYREFLLWEKRLSPASIERKIASLRRFLNYLENKGLITNNPFNEGKTRDLFQSKKPTLPVQLPFFKRLLYLLRHTRPVWYDRYRKLPIVPYLHLGLFVILAGGVGYGAYEQFFKKAQTPLAYPQGNVNVSPKRILPISARLTDSKGEPIFTKTAVTFRFWDREENGKELYSTGSCSIRPDPNGVFTTSIGRDCGAPIPPGVFSENPSIYLGVTVAGDSEMKPRQAIATVAYALNSETLQGHPPSASPSANQIPVITKSGDLVLAYPNPRIYASSGTFQLNGQAVSIVTDIGTNGDITVAPDGLGKLNLIFGGTIGKQINATAANLSESGTLYYGAVANSSTLCNLLKLQSGSPSATLSSSALNDRFTVDCAGNASVGGNAGVSGKMQIGGTLDPTISYSRIGTQQSLRGLSDYRDFLFSGKVEVNENAYFNKQALVSDGSSSAPSLSFFNDPDSGLYRLAADTIALITGGSATQGITIGGTGNVGIGTTSPGYALDVTGTGRFTSNLSVGGALSVSGATTLNGDTTLGDATGDNITFSGRIANGTNIIPATTGSSDLGSSALKFNNLYTNTVNTATLNTSGQAIFTYQPTSTAISEGSIYINPTSATAARPLLSLALGGTEKARITTDGYLGLNGANDPGSTYIINTGSIFNVGTSGNVGLGTTAPIALLDVGGTSWLRGTALGTSGLFVSSGGNVGVGTTNPLTLLHVAGQCVIEGTRIRRRRRKKNGDWEEEDVPVEDIEPGDEVLSLNEKTGQFEWHRVEKTLDNGVKGIWELQTASGKRIVTTGNHPYLILDRPEITQGTFEVDQSIKVENLGRPTIIGVALGKLSFTAQMSQKEKKLILAMYQKRGKTSVFATEVFAMLVVATFRAAKIYPSRVKIDEEYTGTLNERVIKTVINRSFPDTDIFFGHITDHSKAHTGAWSVNRGQKRPDAILGVVSEDTKERPGAKVAKRMVSPMIGYTGLLHSHGLYYNKFYSTEKELSRARWTKVTQVVRGQYVATVDGFEKIVSLYQVGQGHVYDLQIESVHNFVGNNIVAHNTYISGNLGVGATSPSNKLTVSGGVGIGTTAPGSLYTKTATAPDGGLIVEGNVGIGITTPSGKLHVVGSGTTTGFSFRTMDSSLTDRFSILDNGNVGIGTTGPGAPLHVSKSDSSNSIDLAYFFNPSMANAKRGHIRFGRAASSNESAALEFEYNSGGTSLVGLTLYGDAFGSGLVQQKGGNVGIGTTGPIALLDVGGTSWLRGTALGTSGLFVSSGGNVGVGTTNPLVLLHVAGQCVTGDTLLKKRRRRRRKDGTWEEYWEDVRIDEIEEGDEILTLDEKTGKFVPSKVEKLMDMGYQEVFKVITRSGLRIETTNNHPYLVRTKQGKPETLPLGGTFEIDQSPKIEDLTQDSFIAIANEQQVYVLKVSKPIKKQLFELFTLKANRHLKHFGPTIFAQGIAILLNQAGLTPDRLIIDMDYPGYNGIIEEIIKQSLPKVGIDFESVGGNSPAHWASYRFINKKLRHKKTTVIPFEGTVALFHTRPNPEDSQIAHGLFSDKKYTTSWIKVKFLKPGMIIATTRGWEPISTIYPTGRKQTYDIQVAHTHNFVGNDIVAHNTYISGNLGVGATSPSNKLTVSGGVGIGTTAPGSTFTKTATAPDGGLIVEGNVGIGTTTPSGKLHVVGSGTTTGFSFRTMDSSLTDRFAILDNGNVGIGTTGPNVKLHVVNATAPEIKTNWTDATSYGQLTFYENSTNMGTVALIGSNFATTSRRNNLELYSVSGDINFFPGNSQTATFKSGGNVGIGTTGPIALLDVGGTSWLRGTALGTSGLFVSSGGNVGVGTTNPLVLLHVAGQCVTGDTKLKRRRKRKALSGKRNKKITGVGPDPEPDQQKTRFAADSSTRKHFDENSSGPSSTNLPHFSSVVKEDVDPRGVEPLPSGLTDLMPHRSGPTSQNSIADTNEELDYYWEDVRIDQIQEGDEILTLNEETGEFVVAKVNALMDMGIKPVFTLTTVSGKEIRTTGNHPYFIHKKNLSLQDIARGNIEEDSKYPNSNEKQQQTAIDVGEGEVHNFLTLFANVNPILADQIENVKPMITVNTDPTLMVPPGSNSFKTSDAKVILERSNQNSDSFWSSNSERISPDAIKEEVNSSSGIWMKVIYLKPGMEIAVYNDGLANWDTIASIDSVGPEQVWDIEVEGTHNFVGNNIVAHNTYISGNLGVGATSPSNKLTVSGGVGIGTTAPGSTFTKTATAPDGGLIVEGNVGIGITTPSGKLHVVGSGTTTGFSFRTMDSALTDRFVILDNGNVGIGTTGPNLFGFTKVLTISAGTSGDVVPGIELQGFRTTNSQVGQISFAHGSTETMRLAHLRDGADDAGAFLVLTRPTAGSLTERIRITSTGNVGIGTTGPKNKLDVNGSVGIGSYGSGLAGTGPSNGLIVSGRVGIGNSLPANALDIVGGVTIGNFAIGSSAPANGLAVSGNVGIGTTSPNSLLSVAGSTGLALGTSATSAWVVSATAPSGGIIAQGNIGIGVTVAGAALTINGGIIAGTGATSYFITSATAPAGGALFEGNVGIGTTVPAAPLHIYTTSGSTQLRVESNTAGGTPSIVFASQTTDGSGPYILTGIKSQFNGTGYATSRLTLQSVNSSGNLVDTLIVNNGNIGIGITGPAYKLDVVGGFQAIRKTITDATSAPTTTSISDSYLQLGGNEFSANGSTSYRLIGFGYSGTSATYAPAYLGFQEMNNAGYTLGDLIFGTRSVTTNSAASERLRITSAGNVGIGTTGPKNLLDVNGSVAIGTYGTGLAGTAPPNGLIVSGRVGIGNSLPANALDIAGGVTIGNFAIGSSAPANGLAVSGNVGIGTTSPNSLLSVAGSTGLALGTSATSAWVTSATAPSGGIIAQGNVGLGITTPSAFLHISSTATQDLFRVDDNGVGDTSSFVIDQAGNVGIGETPASYKLHVNGTSRFNGDMFKSDGVNALGDSDSMVPNSGFEVNADGTATLADGWTSAGTGSPTFAVTTSAQSQGDRAQQITSGATDTAWISSPCIPITASRGYNLYAQVKSDTAVTDGLYIYLATFPSKSSCDTNALVNYQAAVTDSAVTTSFVDYGATVTPASTERWARVYLYNYAPNVTATFTFDAVRLTLASLTTGVDLAETFPALASDLPKPGEIVRIGNTPENAGFAVRTSTAYDTSVIGIVSTQPGYVLDEGKDYPKVAVALAGRVPVKVSSGNGPITAGDYLTTSGIPGVAMKATQAGPVIGKALEAFSGDGSDSIGTITTLVNLSWYDPGLTVAENGDVRIAHDEAGSWKLETGNSSQVSSLNFQSSIASRLSAFSKAIIANLDAGAARIEELVAQTVTANNVQLTTKLITPLVETTDIVATGTARLSTVETNLIRPIPEGDGIVEIQNAKFKMQNDNAKFKIVDSKENSLVEVDNQGDATFSGKLTANSLQTTDATISGTLYADEIKTKNGSLSDLLAQASPSATIINNVYNTYQVDDHQKTASNEAVNGDSGLARIMDLSSKTILSPNTSDVNNQMGSGPEGNRTPGIGLDRSIPNHSGPTPTPAYNTETASASAQLLASITNEPIISPSKDIELSQSVQGIVAANGLTVFGKASLGETYITGPLLVNGITVDNSSISSFLSTLKIQETAQFPVEIMGGKVAIATNGDLTLEGRLVAKGGINTGLISPVQDGGDVVISLASNAVGAGLVPARDEGDHKGSPLQNQSAFGRLLVKGKNGQDAFSLDASGNASFSGQLIASQLTANSLQTTAVDSKLLAVDELSVKTATTSGVIIAADEVASQSGIIATGIKTNATTGVATLPANQTDLVIYTPYVKDNTFVYLTPLGPTDNKVLFVAGKRAAEFIHVAVDSPINHDVPFNWWIIN